MQVLFLEECAHIYKCFWLFITVALSFPSLRLAENPIDYTRIVVIHQCLSLSNVLFAKCCTEWGKTGWAAFCGVLCGVVKLARFELVICVWTWRLNWTWGIISCILNFTLNNVEHFHYPMVGFHLQCAHQIYQKNPRASDCCFSIAFATIRPSFPSRHKT